MGAETECWVKVFSLEPRWERVSAVTLDDAKEMAWKLDNVVAVGEAQYEQPESENDAPNS